VASLNQAFVHSGLLRFCQHSTEATLLEVAECFNHQHYRSVSYATNQVRQRKRTDKNFELKLSSDKQNATGRKSILKKNGRIWKTMLAPLQTLYLLPEPRVLFFSFSNLVGNKTNRPHTPLEP
jgi:hypothetical protein